MPPLPPPTEAMEIMLDDDDDTNDTLIFYSIDYFLSSKVNCSHDQFVILFYYYVAI